MASSPTIPTSAHDVSLTCDDGGPARDGELGQDEVARHLHIRMVPEAADEVRVDEARRVDAVETRIQQGVHALEGRLADLKPVVDRVLEGTQVDDPVDFE